MSQDDDDLIFKARALAQAHPLSPTASRFVNRAVAREQKSQILPDVGIWAGSAFLDGYCLRRVQEERGGGEFAADLEGLGTPAATHNDRANEADPLDVLDVRSSAIAGQLRAAQAAGGSDEATVRALDGLVARQVDRRLDHLRDHVDEEAWVELGEYLAWWVVKGYALRVAEC